MVAIPKPPPIRPKNLQLQLGRFRKVDLPFSGSEVDPRLLDDKFTPVAEDMVSILKEAACHFILLGKSGTGKTRAIFDVARQFFTIYIECSTSDDRIDVTKDKSYTEMAEMIQKLKWAKPEVARNEAQRLIQLEYTSRLLFLLLLLKKYPDTTPQDFLASQLNGGQNAIMDIVPKLQLETEYDLRVIMRKYCD